jgi:hypothetical protein
MGAGLLQESLNVAVRTDVAKPTDFANVILDTMSSRKAAALPTDAKQTALRWSWERLARPRGRHTLPGFLDS